MNAFATDRTRLLCHGKRPGLQARLAQELNMVWPTAIDTSRRHHRDKVGHERSMIGRRDDHYRPAATLFSTNSLTKLCPDNGACLERDHQPSRPSLEVTSQIAVSARYAAITSGDAERIASAARVIRSRRS